MTDAFESLLGWWLLGCVTDADIVRWADRQIEEATNGADIPEWLIAVSLQGPDAFWKRGLYGDPQPRDPDFPAAFRLMVEVTDPTDEASLNRFVSWIVWAAMGEDLSLEEVCAGYEIEDSLCYKRSAALAPAKDVLAKYRPSCTLIADQLPWRRAGEQ